VQTEERAEPARPDGRRRRGGALGAALRRVTLYSAAGCHLCESARRVLRQVGADVAFELEEVDIAADPDLERRYRERIPVVAVDGVETFTYFVHPDALRRRLGA
jgi:glutaredoxin